MNKKGFTITELLAVIVILGILTSLASVGVTRYRQTVKEKELINLHSTIETGFDDYRSKVILSGDSVENKIELCQDGKLLFDISYNGNKLKCNSGEDNVNIEKATVITKIKGDLLSDDDYRSIRTEEKHYIEDGTCMVRSEKEDVEGTSQIVKHCQGTEPNYLASKEEITCIILQTKSEKIINDFEDENSMCRYWSE